LRSLISGSPASISGTICPGDEVAHVDGVPVGGRTPSELRDVVVGPVGMPVTLGIIPARGVIDVKLVRGSSNNASSTSPDQSVVSSEEAAGWEAERRELGEELERQRALRAEAEGKEAALREERDKLSFEVRSQSYATPGTRPQSPRLEIQTGPTLSARLLSPES
jgi:hypothetical protein